MYEYLPIEQAKPGDIVEYQSTNYEYIYDSKLHFVSKEGITDDNRLGVIDKSGNNVWSIKSNGKILWKLVKTKPGSEAKVGDEVIYTQPNIGKCEQGKIYTVHSISQNTYIHWHPTKSYNRRATEFRLLCKAESADKPYPRYFKPTNPILYYIVEFTSSTEGTVVQSNTNACKVGYHNFGWATHTDTNSWKEVPKPTTKDNRPIAYYKRSGEPWTIEELQRIPNFWKKDLPWDRYKFSLKWVYPDSEEDIYFWDIQNVKGMQQVAFEDAFPTYESPEMETKQSHTKEHTMNKLDLKLLSEMMSVLADLYDIEKTTNATNAQHVGILTESDGSYVGYVYANTTDELEEVMRSSENEGRKLHVFDYSTTLAQKPRKIVKVERS